MPAGDVQRYRVHVSGRYPEPFSVTFTPLHLSLGALRGLSWRLRAWLGQPLAALASSALQDAAELAAGQGERCRLSFDTRSTVLRSRPGEVVARCELQQDVLCFVVSFVVSVTELDAFVDQVDGAAARP